MGKSEFNSVASLLEIGLTHLLLAHSSQRPEPVAHRRSEAFTALSAATCRYAPGAGQRLDLGEVCTSASIAVREKLAADGGPANSMPASCPFTVGDLIRRTPDLDALLARLADAPGPLLPEG